MSERKLDTLLRLWSDMPADTDEALRAFGQHYTDPVLINGASMSLRDLVERARGQQRACSEIRIELLEQIDLPDRTVIAFLHHAKHTGPLSTPLGDVAPTGKTIVRKVIDILHFAGDRIDQVHVVADELGGLLQLGALKLA